MMRSRHLFLVILAVVSMASCKSQYEIMLNSNDADAKYDAAFAYFNEGKYSKAASLFESLSVLTNGTERDDTVRYYWGLSNYRFRDYYTAETNFTQFIESFPRSPFTSDARYLRIDCLYRSTLRYELDQTPTYTAINAISEYMLEFPDTPHMQECKDMLTDLNERLDKKAYEAAKLYYKMEDYLASRVALRNVLKDDADNVYREDVLYHIAMSSYKYAYLSIPSKQKESYLVFNEDFVVLLRIAARRLTTNLHGAVGRHLSKPQFTGYKTVFVTHLQQPCHFVTVNTHAVIIVRRIGVHFFPRVVGTFRLVAGRYGQIHRDNFGVVIHIIQQVLVANMNIRFGLQVAQIHFGSQIGACCLFHRTSRQTKAQQQRKRAQTHFFQSHNEPLSNRSSKNNPNRVNIPERSSATNGCTDKIKNGNRLVK